MRAAFIASIHLYVYIYRIITASRTELTSTLSGLSDSQLLEQTSRLAFLDHEIQVFVIDHLLEIDARRLYLSRGFSGLFDYVKRGLGYSDAAAWRRINAMKLCAHVEGARERLRDGSLTLDAAAQLQAAFERRDRERARAARNAKAESGAGAARRRSGSAPSLPPLGPPPEQKPVPDLDVSARKALVDEAAGKSTRQVMQMLAEVDPEMVVPTDRVRALSGGRWELKAVIDAECQRGLEQLKELLSHVDPHMTLGHLVGRLVKEGLDRHDPGRPRRGRHPGSQPAGTEQTSAPGEAFADGAVASAAKKSRPQADAKRSTAKGQADPRHGAPSPAQRSAHPAGACSAPASRQRDTDRRATSAPKRLAQPPGTTTSPAKTRQDLDRATPSPANGPARSTDPASAPKAGARGGRAVPAAVKREVWRRDGGRCRYVDLRSGRRCTSRHLLHIDHVFPYALGGGAEPANLRLLCAAHHRHRHAERASPREPDE